MAVELNIVLSAELSGRKAIRLSWTAEQNANFEIFWKSNIPAGQEYALLASTNAFEYTTADLEPSKIYQFYVRGWIGEQFFISNAVELFVSCGKGVVLTGGETDEPPCQLAIVGRAPLAPLGIIGNVACFTQDPTNNDSFYFLEAFASVVDGSTDHRLWKFTWPSTMLLIATITDTGVNAQGILQTTISKISYNPSSGAYNIAFAFANGSPFVEETVIIDVNLSTGTISKMTTHVPGILTRQMFSFVSGVDLYFCCSGPPLTGPASAYSIKKLAGSPVGDLAGMEAGSTGTGFYSPLSSGGNFLYIGSAWKAIDMVSLVITNPAPVSPSFIDIYGGGTPTQVKTLSDWRFRFANSATDRCFVAWNCVTDAESSAIVQSIIAGSVTSYNWGLYHKTNHSIMVYGKGEDGKRVYISKLLYNPSVIVYGTKSIVIDGGVNLQVSDCHFAYPYVYVFHRLGDNGQCVTKLCNGVA